MLLHIILYLQILLAPAIMPGDNIKVKLLNNTNTTMEYNAPEGDDFTYMIQRYTNYNHWANQQFAAWLGTASEEELELEIESSFSSLKETVFHIWNAEYLWLQIVKDEPYDNSPVKNFEGTKEELLDGWIQASENFKNHVQSMSLENLKAERANSRGEGFTGIADMIHHCMNHSTYHRGQLITMGRQAGLVDPPRTDFIYYVRLQAG